MATSPAPSRTKFPYLAALDGLRGVLVIPVALFHFSITAGADMLLAPGSYFAPSMFFALSGFLITSLLLVERTRTGQIDGQGFWTRRFRRLLPASVFVVGFCVAVSAVWPTVWSLTEGDVLASLFSVKNWQSIVVSESDNPLRLLSPLGVYWSLAVEEQFYLGLFAVVALSLRARNGVKVLTGALVAVWCASAAAVIMLEGSTVREMFGTDTRASELAAGCLMAVAVHHYGWPRARWWVAYGWAAAAASVVGWALVAEEAQWIRDWGLVGLSVLNIGLIGGAVVEGSFARVLRWRPLVELGKISYPVYLVHWPVALLMSPERMDMTGWPLIIVRFVVSVAAGYLIARYLEAPIRRRQVLPGWRGFVAWASATTAIIVVSLAVLEP